MRVESGINAASGERDHEEGASAEEDEGWAGLVGAARSGRPRWLWFALSVGSFARSFPSLAALGLTDVRDDEKARGHSSEAQQQSRAATALSTAHPHAHHTQHKAQQQHITCSNTSLAATASLAATKQSRPPPPLQLPRPLCKYNINLTLLTDNAMEKGQAGGARLTNAASARPRLPATLLNRKHISAKRRDVDRAERRCEHGRPGNGVRAALNCPRRHPSRIRTTLNSGTSGTDVFSKKK